MSDEETVHILDKGFALCRFGEGEFPGEWPPGHLWTYPWDLNRVTCERCLEKAKNAAEGQSPPATDA